uniref:Uncharacterized protein n=1 Tax=Zea mays TaxID=4577 RepID=B6SPE2_MAIZE|nr:hypothetical protein [Zea mays]
MERLHKAPWRSQKRSLYPCTRIIQFHSTS